MVQGCGRYEIGGFYTFFLTLQLSTSFAIFFLNFLLLIGVIRTKFLPKNVRFLLGNMTIAFLLVAIDPFRNRGYIVILTHGSLIPVNNIICGLWILLYYISAGVIRVTMCSLGIERWRATKRVNRGNEQTETKLKGQFSPEANIG